VRVPPWWRELPRIPCPCSFAPLRLVRRFREWVAAPLAHAHLLCVVCAALLGAFRSPVYVNGSFPPLAHRLLPAIAVPPTSSHLATSVCRSVCLVYRLQYAVSVPTTFPYILAHKKRRVGACHMLRYNGAKCGHCKFWGLASPQNLGN
jgi:hypothetical protein